MFVKQFQTPNHHFKITLGTWHGMVTNRLLAYVPHPAPQKLSPDIFGRTEDLDNIPPPPPTWHFLGGGVERPVWDLEGVRGTRSGSRAQAAVGSTRKTIKRMKCQIKGACD